MASTDISSPPPTKKAKTEQQEESQLPLSFKPDGISPRKPHLRREDTVTEIYDEAIRCQHVVVGSPPASGKTSLLQLLKVKLRGLEDAPRILRLNLTSDRSVEDLMQELATYGVTEDVNKLEQLKNTWILIDDAQNAYDTKFNPFWEFVVKHIASVDEIAKELRVVIASTYDLSTPTCPVNFVDLAHIQPNATETEARELFQIYAEQLNCQHMSRFRETLVDISKLASDKTPGLSPPEPPRYHLGVMMAGLRVLKDNKKTRGVHVLVEDAMLQELRGAGMLDHLKRCFKLPKDLSPTFQEHLLDAVTGESGDSVEFSEQKELKPFLRSGILSRTGKFRSIAAQWYYNKTCFPDRAARRPEQLDDLVKFSVQSLSARRLRDAATAGFPKEATFQHLFNEAMSKQLPIQHGIIPELNTFAKNEEGNVITGELDFYVNGSLKWALELLRNGDKIGEHLKRFDPTIGKYRKVVMKDYLVVDCRPKKQSSVQLAENRCTLFFADDFKHCVCQMRMEEEIKLILAN